MKNGNAKIVIVGGGSGGISVAARLRNQGFLSITIIDPADQHYYQPLWTLVGGGAASLADTVRPMKNVIPRGVQWIPEAVRSFDPDNNNVATDHGSYSYDYLILAPGIQINWDSIKGLKAAMGKGGVCSNYSAKTVKTTWQAIQNFSSGPAIFTYPNTPIKCGGAPQKIMYLAEHYFRQHGKRTNAEVRFASAGGAIFGVKKYADALSKIVLDRGIETSFGHNLVEIRGDERIAVFETADGLKEMDYRMIHVTPPMGAPDFIKNSPLAGEGGWVAVDKYNLQHNKYSNVFSLGDASSLPTSKTGAAIRKQAPVLVANLVGAINGQELRSRYDGYTSCPLVTGYGRLILAEFDYDGNPAESFPFDQGVERLSMYLLKKHLLPVLYWQGMLKGRA